MADPITTSTKQPVNKDLYVKLQAGAYNKYGSKYDTNIGVTLGGEISKGGTYANLEAGYGTTFRAEANVGHEFKLGKNIGLELAGNAEYLRDNSKSSYMSTININGKEDQFKKEWHNGYFKAGGSSMLTFKGKKGNIKAGLECGYRANNAPNISQTIEMQYQDNGNIVKQKVTNSVNLKESGFYATPKVSAELKLGKKGNWSLIADADMYQGNAGIKYTF